MERGRKWIAIAARFWSCFPRFHNKYILPKKYVTYFRLKCLQVHINQITVTSTNMKVKYTPIFVISLVLLSGLPLISTGTTNFAMARYANTQTQAIVNECTGPNVNCAVTSPQTLGDGGASTPINKQISKFNQEINGPEIPGGSGVPTINVRMTVLCPTGFVCPGPADFLNALSISTVPQSVPERSNIMELNPEQAVIDLFFLSATELQFSIQIDQSQLPSTPPGLTLQLDTQTCSGTVNTELSSTCIFSNEYVPAQPPQG
jgi:hypothetical protein